MSRCNRTNLQKPSKNLKFHLWQGPTFKKPPKTWSSTFNTGINQKNCGTKGKNLASYIQTYIHTYLPTYLHTYIPTYLHTYIPTYIHTYLPTYIPTYLHTYIPTYLHTYIPTYLHTYIPTYLHTYIHTKPVPFGGNPICAFNCDQEGRKGGERGTQS